LKSFFALLIILALLIAFFALIREANTAYNETQKRSSVQSKLTQGSSLDKAIDSALADLVAENIAGDEYGVVLDRVSKLHKMRETENSHRVSPDTLVLAATNLIGIFLIINHERLNVITSKAMGFIRLR